MESFPVRSVRNSSVGAPQPTASGHRLEVHGQVGSVGRGLRGLLLGLLVVLLGLLVVLLGLLGVLLGVLLVVLLGLLLGLLVVLDLVAGGLLLALLLRAVLALPFVTMALLAPAGLGEHRLVSVGRQLEVRVQVGSVG